MSLSLISYQCLKNVFPSCGFCNVLLEENLVLPFSVLTVCPPRKWDGLCFGTDDSGKMLGMFHGDGICTRHHSSAPGTTHLHPAPLICTRHRLCALYNSAGFINGWWIISVHSPNYFWLFLGPEPRKMSLESSQHGNPTASLPLAFSDPLELGSWHWKKKVKIFEAAAMDFLFLSRFSSHPLCWRLTFFAINTEDNGGIREAWGLWLPSQLWDFSRDTWYLLREK